MTRGIILSGGWGTRLRPLTCTIPKTLIPVCNIPVIERQMLLLKKAGVSEIVLAVSVMAEDLKAYFKDGEKLALKIHYTNEESPMGTAGAIKLAENYLKDDNFFMLNGDVILDFDFSKMLNFHEEKGATGTIASKIVDDPSRYGVLIADVSGKIEKFLEKAEYVPPEDGIVPMPINAGVYVLEPEVLDLIPPHKKVSIENDVFPKIAEKEGLYHHPITGIWKDIGKPEELLLGNILLMKQLIEESPGDDKNLIDKSLDIEGKALIYPPVMIGKNVTIRKDCVLGPDVVIGDNVYIGEGSEIKESLIFNESYIGNDVKIERSIISDNCEIKDYCVLLGNEDNLVILASHVRVLEKIRLIAPEFNSLTVCHHEMVKESRNF